MIDFTEGPIPPFKESFNYHTAIIVLPSGEGEYPQIKFQCHGASKDDCACSFKLCQMEDNYRSVGWDMIRAAGDIELARLSARMDWSDAEEAWIDLEP